MSTDKVSTQLGSAKKGIEYQQAEDFVESYANNIQLLSSNWDLELVFGKLDQSIGPNAVIQHTSITMPWAQAKVLLFFLQLHVLGHESDLGRIIVPRGIIPDFPAQKPKEADAVNEQTWKRVRKLYEEFIAANPEAMP